MAMLDDALTDLQQRIAALERELDARTAERDEALAQQSATTEVLQVINSSPGDLFEAVLDKATRLCGASFGALTIYRGDDLHEVVAMRGMGSSSCAATPFRAALADDTRAEIDEIVGMLTGNLEKIAEHGRRADGIVKSMLAHSRGTSGERQTVDISSLVDESLNLAYHGARAQDQNFNITLERDLDFSIAPIELVPQDVTRVFLNLFGNGFYAADKRGKEANEKTFRPTLKVTTRDLGANVEIRVRDNGAGIPPEVKEKLFQPFFTTKPTGEGTGLGLWISYDIVAQQHGDTAARSPSTAARANSPNSRSDCRVPGRAQPQGWQPQG